MNIGIMASTIGFLVAILASGDCNAAPSSTSMREAALQVARRSGLSQDELRIMFADCSANQQTITFCAWRDQVAAEIDLQKTLSRVKAQSPVCGNRLARKASLWKRRRDSLCNDDAAKEFGGGSNEAAARSQCAASMTLDYAQQIRKHPSCNAP